MPTIPLRQESSPAFQPFEQPVIARDKVRYVGEPLAVVLATSAAAAEDALDAIACDIESLPAVVDSATAAMNEVLLFEAAGSNLALTLRGVRGDADAAFARADYVRRERFSVQRHGAVPMEPRGLVAEWDAVRERLTVYGAAKVAFPNRRVLAAQMDLPESADSHGRERRRRRLRRPRRILPRGLSDCVCGAPQRPAGQVDRGSPRASHGHQSCPRRRL